MRIIVSLSGGKVDPWISGLREALPGAAIEAWVPGAPPADHAVVWMPPQQLLDEQPLVKGIFNIGAGVDALLALRLPSKACVVRIDDGGMAVQMAEFVTHAVIRHVRELDVYARQIAQGTWSYRRPLDRAAYPVGIMGLGVLGTRVAGALRAFELPLRGWSRSRKSMPGMQCFAGADELTAFLSGTRILVCLLPLTAETEGIMNREHLSELLPGAYVINVARGAHLVDDDLLALIASGHVAGAALDVFRTEPLPAGHPFWLEPKITITPHTSARTLREESIEQIARKIIALDRGEPVSGIVDRARGY